MRFLSLLRSHLRSNVRRQAGTTLTELLIYLGLVTILLGVLTQIFVAILDVQLTSEATSTVEQDSRYIISRLAYDIQRADAVSIPATVGEESNNLQMIINGISYVYSVDNDRLMLSRSGESHQLNSYGSGISGFTLKRIGNTDGKDTLQLTFTTTSTTLVNDRYETKTLQTTIGTR